ncbi:unnamed protein product [Spirodela intermedia]|uniref:CCAAT-binding factor domain-containing protein n=1 Tax=Spirodela intermedia TaxID=51605 RepID=A0A7I8K2H3_SPIIN|nr:unnamed protein product [Spirodela intermedia]
MASASSKKQRRSNEGETLTLNQLRTLGEQLLSSKAHVNNLPRLLSFLSPSSPLQFVLESLLTLQSFFITLLPEIQSSPSPQKFLALELPRKDEEDPEAVYRVWLRSRFDEFVNSLIQLAVFPRTEETIKDVVLDALMEFIKLGKGGRFQSAIYHKLIHSLVHSASSVQLTVDLLVTKYLKFIDVRYFTYTSLGKVTKSYESTCRSEDGERNPESGDVSGRRLETAIHNIYNILSHIPVSDTENTSSSEALPVNGDPKRSKMVGSSTHITKKFKAKFTKAWISFLKLPLSLDVYKEVLVALPQMVIPHVANPVILCDFLTRSYDIGGVISVMSLSSLFILITQHGVEYPNYYDKLYALLNPSIFLAKHRARFLQVNGIPALFYFPLKNKFLLSHALQLLDTSLKSSHLPAYVAAAFTKKLSRLTLSAPPSGSLVIIAIIHNLLRRHPSINFLVHQPVGDEKPEHSSNGADESIEDGTKSGTGPRMGGMKRGKDPFNIEETDLGGTNRKSPSFGLFSLDVMKFVASLETDLTVRAKTSEVTVADFCSGSYSSIFRDEIKKRIKQVPVAFYKATPASLFSASDFAGWSFGEES